MSGDRLTTLPLIRLTFIFALVACGCGCANGKAKDDKVMTTNEPASAGAGAGAAMDAAPSSQHPVEPPSTTAESDCATGKQIVSVADRFDCTADEDCVTTCQWGAVNWRGYKLLDDDCEDGCASKGVNARCVESRCTSFDLAGKRIDGCSDIAAPEDVCVDRAVAEAANQCQGNQKLVPTRSRFACDNDSQCVMNCAYGAVERRWSGLLGEGCDDGCASDGMYAKCIANRCVAFHENDKRSVGCTEKPAPDAICVAKK